MKANKPAVLYLLCQLLIFGGFRRDSRLHCCRLPDSDDIRFYRWSFILDQ
jgi:hypothetical protein